MPSKGNRAAVRQAKLRQKKRRGKAASQVFDTGPSKSGGAIGEPEPKPQAEARPAVTSVAQTSAPPRTRRRAARTPASEDAPSYPYLRSELRRVAVVTGIVMAILAALTFVLGS